MTFPKALDIPLGKWVDAGMEWVLNNYGPFFDSVGETMLWFLIYLERFFVWLPWPVFVGVVFLASWKLIGKRAAFGLTGLTLLIGCLGYWVLAMKTLALVTGAVTLSLMMGVPLGIAMSRSDKFQALLKPVLDAMQTMPSFVYLIPVMMLFGLGKVPAIFATIIYSMPPIIRLTNVGMREVPPNLIETGKAYGLTKWQIMRRIELPLARPTIVVGINQTTMMALAMVVVASMIGAKGLGMEVLVSINRIDIGKGFESGLCIVILAIVIDRLTYSMATRNDPLHK